MKTTSTLRSLAIVVISILTFGATAQQSFVTSPMNFSKPELVSGTAGENGAIYKFTNVVTHSGQSVDAYIELKNKVNGAILVNMDDSTLGYYHAWQPTVGGPGITGQNSYIEWEVTFKKGSSSFTPTTAALTAIDVDGDGGKVREFVQVKNYNTIRMPMYVPTVLSLFSLSNSGPGNNEHKALGPVTNRADIDTASKDVRITYTFANQNKIKVSTGSYIENNGYAGGMATSRYFCLYFKDFVDNLALLTLPVKLISFDAYAEGKTARLKWTSENEVNVDRFEVERSFDNKNFKVAAVVLDGIQVAPGSKQYAYKDATVGLESNNVVYYRLKAFDKDGKVTYSAVRAVRFDAATLTVQTFPNPFTASLNVTFNCKEATIATVKVLSLKGNAVAKTSQQVTAGSNTINVNNISGLASGIYVVEVTADNKVLGRTTVIK